MQTPDPEIPQWILYLAGGLATLVSGILIRLGFVRGATGQAMPEKPANVAAVVVDADSLHKLTASIEGHGMAVIKGYLIAEKLLEQHELIAAQLTKLCTIFDDKHREEVDDKLDAALDAIAKLGARMEEIDRAPKPARRRTARPRSQS